MVTHHPECLACRIGEEPDGPAIIIGIRGVRELQTNSLDIHLRQFGKVGHPRRWNWDERKFNPAVTKPSLEARTEAYHRSLGRRADTAMDSSSLDWGACGLKEH